MGDIVTRADMSGHYAALGIVAITSQEEQYVLMRARGLNPTAAARAAHYANPVGAVADLAQNPNVCRAIAYFREMSRQSALAAGALEFTKDDATALYLEAHAKSATATEEIKAVDSLVKLHGLATPERVELNITTRSQMESLDDEALLRLAGQEIALSPLDYLVVNE